MATYKGLKVRFTLIYEFAGMFPYLKSSWKTLFNWDYVGWEDDSKSLFFKRIYKKKAQSAVFFIVNPSFFCYVILTL